MEIISKLPCLNNLNKVNKINAEVGGIISGRIDKFLLIVGPCSADDPTAVLEYAEQLARIHQKVGDKICIVVRVFTAKPRSACSGYMGLVHEPGGVETARSLHLAVNDQAGLPTADELLYPALLPYFEGIVSYFAIGARSSENQEHRLVASGLTTPAGLKNPISGDLQSMANAVSAANAPHDFIFGGHMVRSDGNPLAHGILRGGVQPNYHANNLRTLHEMGLSAVIVDASHANSGKNYRHQPQIAMDVLESRRQSPSIRGLVKGLMVESYIEEGAANRGAQAFGQSITDPCLGLAATEKLIYEIADKL